MVEEADAAVTEKTAEDADMAEAAKEEDKMEVDQPEKVSQGDVAVASEKTADGTDVAEVSKEEAKEDGVVEASEKAPDGTEAAKEEADAQADAEIENKAEEDAPAQESSDEKRIHKDDKTKTAYTYKEFVEFNNGDEKKAWEMWEDSAPVKEKSENDSTGADDAAKEGEESAEAPPAKKARREGPFRVVKVPKGDAETAVWQKLEELCKACGVTAEFEEAEEEETEGNDVDMTNKDSVKEGEEKDAEHVDEKDVDMKDATGNENVENSEEKSGEQEKDESVKEGGQESGDKEKDETGNKEGEESGEKEKDETGNKDGEESAEKKDETGNKDGEESAEKKVAVLEVGLRVRNMSTKRVGCVVAVSGSEPDSFKVKFDDGEEGERKIEKFEAEDGRQLSSGGATEKSSGDFIKLGAIVEGKYGDGWFEATIRGIGDDSVRIRWAFNDSEEQVLKEDLRAKGAEATGSDHAQEEWAAEPEPPAKPARLVISGGTERARMEMEVQVMAIVEQKEAEYYSKSPRESDTCDGLGWSVVRLVNDGEFRAKVIGKKGGMRKKIMKVCGSCFDLLTNTAYIVGTGEERAKTLKLLDLIQLPKEQAGPLILAEELRPICSYAFVPQEAYGAVLGRGRAVLNGIEDATGCIAFFMGTGAASRLLKGQGVRSKEDFKEGLEVECSMRGQWYKAKVVETFMDEDDDLMVRVRWESDGKETDLPPNRVREWLDGDAAAARKRQTELQQAKVLAILGPEPTWRRLTILRVLDALEVDEECKEKQLARGWWGDAWKASCAVETVAAETDIEHLEKMELAAEQATKCREEASLARLLVAGEAADCLINPIGEEVYLVGSEEARKAGKDYVGWWLKGEPEYEVDQREEVGKHYVPKDKVANLTESVIATVERETKTFCMWDDGAALAGIEDSSRILICGRDPSNRQKAAEKLDELKDIEPEQPAWDNAAEGDKKWEQNDEEWKSDEWAKDDKADETWDKKEDAPAQDSSDEKRIHKDDKTKTPYTYKDFVEFNKGDEKKAWQMWEDSTPVKEDAPAQDSSDEKRIHKDDKTKTAYSYKDFVEFNKGDEKKAWQMWEDSTPVKDDKWDKNSDDKWDKKDAWAKDAPVQDASEEKRIHKDDKTKTPYTYKEFKDFNKGDEKKAWQMWEDSTPVKDDKWGKTADDQWNKKADDKWDKKDEWAKDDKWGKKAETWDKKDEWAAADKWGKADEWGKDSAEEKRVHPSDKAKQAYSYNEYLEFSKGDTKKAQRMWDESKPSQDGSSASQSSGGNEGGKRDWDSRGDARETSAKRLRSSTWEGASARPSPAIGSGSRQEVFRPGRASGPPAPRHQGGLEAPRYAPPPSSTSRHEIRRPALQPAPARGAPARGAPVPERRPIPRRIVEAPPPVEEEPEDFEEDGEEEASDGEFDAEVLEKLEAIGFPESIGDWCGIQEEVWGNAPPLKKGWIRIWSRSQKCEYYMRVEDQYSTFDVSEASLKK